MRHFLIGGMCLLVISFLPLTGFAESYTPLSDVPGLLEASEASEKGEFAPMINTIYRLSIGLSAILAVFMIIWAGISYSASSVASVKSRMTERISLAIGGLVLLLGAYMLLNIINPQLLVLKMNPHYDSIDYDNITPYTPVAVRETEGVTFQGGFTETELFESLQTISEEEYQRYFGRAPLYTRVQDDRVELTPDEQAQLRNILAANPQEIKIEGVEYINGLPSCTKQNPNASFEVPVESQQLVALAIKDTCPNIPQSWAVEPGLYKIIACESTGKVGVPNYALKGYMENTGVSQERMTTDIRNGLFYYNHCCQTQTRVQEEMAAAGISKQCDMQTQNGLPDYATAQAAAGTTGYSHLSGLCPSAAGIGQLLNINMRTYQPSGVRGYGIAEEEICGMLNYIDTRYKSPATAWTNYTNKGY